jgi:hypothetical protein
LDSVGIFLILRIPFCYWESEWCSSLLEPTLGANLEVLAEYLSLVNTGAELGFFCISRDWVQFLASVLELLYIRVLLGRNGRLAPRVLFLRRRRTRSLFVGRLETCRCVRACVPIIGRRSGPSISHRRSWARSMIVG